MPAGQRDLVAVFSTGIALNLGNPKMPLFYLALLPSVVGATLTPGQVGLLAAVIIAVKAAVIGAHVALATRTRALLRTPRVIRWANHTAGGVIIGVGVAIVTKH